MIANYDIFSLAIVYLVTKMVDPKDNEGYECPAFMDISTEEWYSAKDLNQIINN